MVKRLALGLALLLAVLLPLAADSSYSLKLLFMDTLARLDEDTWSTATTGQGLLTFKSRGNKNVKAQLGLETIYAGGLFLPDIDTAYLKVRFPLFRTTIGKAKISWGEGFFFNAGDVVFKNFTGSTDFTADVLRDDGAWLTSVWIPLGRFAFAEALVIPAGITIANPIPEFSKTSAGLRIEGKILEIKTEAGYFFNGSDIEGLPYMSLQGNLFELIDWYSAASISIDHQNPESFEFTDAFRLSTGLFYQHSFEDSSTLNLRLESMIVPGASWEEKSGPATEYGIYLFPEISYSPDQFLSFSLRTFFSPIDLSALTMIGINWEIYQGLTWMNNGAFQLGEESDIFSFGRSSIVSGQPAGLPSFYFTTGLQFIF